MTDVITIDTEKRKRPQKRISQRSDPIFFQSYFLVCPCDSFFNDQHLSSLWFWRAILRQVMFCLKHFFQPNWHLFSQNKLSIKTQTDTKRTKKKVADCQGKILFIIRFRIVDSTSCLNIITEYLLTCICDSIEVYQGYPRYIIIL